MTKKGLGKGLSALISETNTAKTEEDVSPGVTEVDINSVEPNRSQPRKYFDDQSLLELADSIREYGVLQPVLVTKEDGFYSIVAGERRWRAARLAKLETIPVIIKDYSGSETLQIALIENLQREDINPIEEALTYKRLMDEFFFRQEDVAAKIGKSRGSVSYSLSLLQLDSRVQEMVIHAELSPSVARVLIPLPDGDLQHKAAESILAADLSAPKAEKYVASLMERLSSSGAPGDTENEPAKLSKPYFDIERDLNLILGTKVCIKDGKKKGRIEIEYYSPEDLDRLIGIFKSGYPEHS